MCTYDITKLTPCIIKLIGLFKQLHMIRYFIIEDFFNNGLEKQNNSHNKLFPILRPKLLLPPLFAQYLDKCKYLCAQTMFIN